MNDIKVEGTICISIGDNTIELTLDEAKLLKTLLIARLGDEAPSWYPTTDPHPAVWPGVAPIVTYSMTK